MPLDTALLPAIEVTGPAVARGDEVLTPEALAFLAELHRRFDARRLRAARRRGRGARQLFDARRTARLPGRDARRPRRRLDASRPIPADLQDRRVEITGPVDRKMIINALNSGAKVFMADFEDATTPDLGQPDRGPGQSEGPLGRRPRLHRPDSGKAYALGDDARPC